MTTTTEDRYTLSEALTAAERRDRETGSTVRQSLRALPGQQPPGQLDGGH